MNLFKKYYTCEFIDENGKLMYTLVGEFSVFKTPYSIFNKFEEEAAKYQLTATKLRRIK